MIENPTLSEFLWTLAEEDALEMRREILRASLAEIVNDIAMAMRDAGLTFPVGITVPNSGDLLAMIGSPLDPSDTDWSRVVAIVCGVVSKKLGGRQLRGRALASAVADATINAADVIPDSPDVETGEDH